MDLKSSAMLIFNSIRKHSINIGLPDQRRLLSKHGYTKNGLSYRKTKQGCRAGKRKHKPPIQRKAPGINVNKPVRSTWSSTVATPSILYTNYISLNQWKLDGLTGYVQIYEPDILAWFDDIKEQSINIDGFNNHFCSSKKGMAGGFANPTSQNFTTRTFSAIWVHVSIGSYKPLIVCCLYHLPNADQDTTQVYISSTILKLSKCYIIHSNTGAYSLANICEWPEIWSF